MSSDLAIRIIGSNREPLNLQKCLGGRFVEVNPGDEFVVEVENHSTDRIKAKVVIDGTDWGPQQLAGYSTCYFPWQVNSHPNGTKGKIDLMFYPVDDGIVDSKSPLVTQTICYHEKGSCPIAAKKLPQLGIVLMVDGQNVNRIDCADGSRFYAKSGQKFELFITNVQAEPVQLGVTLDHTNEVPLTIAPKSSSVFSGILFAEDPKALRGQIRLRLLEKIAGCIIPIKLPDLRICYSLEDVPCPVDLLGLLSSGHSLFDILHRKGSSLEDLLNGWAQELRKFSSKRDMS